MAYMWREVRLLTALAMAEIAPLLAQAAIWLNDSAQAIVDKIERDLAKEETP
jgi:hypothetical protein